MIFSALRRFKCIGGGFDTASNALDMDSKAYTTNFAMDSLDTLTPSGSTTTTDESRDSLGIESESDFMYSLLMRCAERRLSGMHQLVGDRLLHCRYL